MIVIRIQGDPIPLKRPRFRTLKNKVYTYDAQIPEKTRVQNEIKIILKQENIEKFPITCPLRICIDFFIQMPKIMLKKETIDTPLNVRKTVPHCKRPDIDNLIKFYFDCMNGIVFKDDSQIYSINSSKLYSSQNPGVLITIYPSKEIHIYL